MPTRPSPRSERLGTPNTPAIRFTRDPVFEASLVRVCYGLSGCSPPWTDRTKFPWPTGDFYIQASGGSVALPTAGYDYNSHWTPLLAGLSPAGMAASLAAPDLDEPVALAIPAGHGHAPPRRGRVGQHLGQVRQARALGPGSADCSRPARRRWFVEGGVEAETGDTDHPMPDKGGQELEGGETAVSHKHQRPLRYPATGLEDQLARPVGQFLVPFAVLAAVPLGGRQGGQEGQRPDPPGPGDRDQQHQAEPAQAARLDEVAVAGADRVAVDPFGTYAFAAPALDRVVDAEDHWPLRYEGVQQQPEQHTRCGTPAPGGTVEDAMKVHEPPLLAEPGDPENAGHRAPARRQDGSDQKHLGMPPTPLEEERRKAENDRGEAGWQS